MSEFYTEKKDGSFSIVHVGVDGDSMNFNIFESSDVVLNGETILGYLQRMHPEVDYWSKTLLQTERIGDFSVYSPSDLAVDVKNSDVSKRIVMFASIAGCAVNFLDNVWLIPTTKNGFASICSDAYEHFVFELGNCINKAFDGVSKKTMSVLPGMNFFTPLKEEQYTEETGDVGELLMRMMASVLPYSDMLICMLSKIVLASSAYYKLHKDDGLDGVIEKTIGRNVLALVLPQEEYLKTVERTNFATLATVFTFARVVARYSGYHLDDSPDSFNLFANPGAFRMAIRRAMEHGADKTIGNLLLAQTNRISDIGQAYHNFVNLIDAVDGLKNDIPIPAETYDMFVGDYGNDEKTERAIQSLSEILKEIEDVDDRIRGAFLLNDSSLKEIMIGMGSGG